MANLRFAYGLIRRDARGDAPEGDQRFVPISRCVLATVSKSANGAINLGIRSLVWDPKEKVVKIGAVGYGKHGYVRQQQVEVLERLERIKGRTEGQATLSQRDAADVVSLEATLDRLKREYDQSMALAYSEVKPWFDARINFRVTRAKDGTLIQVRGPKNDGNTPRMMGFHLFDVHDATKVYQPKDCEVFFNNSRLGEAYCNGDIKDATDKTDDITRFKPYLEWLKDLRSEGKSKVYALGVDEADYATSRMIRQQKDLMSVYFRGEVSNVDSTMPWMPTFYFISERELDHSTDEIQSQVLGYARDSTNSPLAAEMATHPGIILRIFEDTKASMVHIVVRRMIQEDRTERLQELGVDPANRKPGEVLYRLSTGGTPVNMNEIALDNLSKLPKESYTVFSYPMNKGNTELYEAPCIGDKEQFNQEAMEAATYGVIRENNVASYIDPKTKVKTYGLVNKDTRLVKVVDTKHWKGFEDLCTNGLDGNTLDWLESCISKSARPVIGSHKGYRLDFVDKIPDNLTSEQIFISAAQIRGLISAESDSLVGSHGRIRFDLVNSWWSKSPTEIRRYQAGPRGNGPRSYGPRPPNQEAAMTNATPAAANTQTGQ